MYSFLNEDKLLLLEKDPVISAFMKGRLKHHELKSYLDEHLRDLIAKGLTRDDIQALHTVDNESWFTRVAGQARFVRFINKLGFSLATPEDKVIWIKRTSAEQFLDLLAAANGYLLGKEKLTRFTKTKGKTIVQMLGSVVDLEPPANAWQIFTEFYKSFQRKLSVANISILAAELYTAIVFLHLFANGNGRLARCAYFILRSTGKIAEGKSLDRCREIMEFAHVINQNAIMELMKKEGLPVKSLENAIYYQANETEDVGLGYTSSLKYIAARRLMKAEGTWTADVPDVWGDHWSKEFLARFRNEYENVLVEFFWMVIQIVDENPEWCTQTLDKAILGKA